MPESRAARLRALLDERSAVLAPGVFDGLSASLTARAGFRAAYMTGAGVAAVTGLPDVGLATQSEMVRQLGLVAGLLDIPESYYESAELEGANWFQRTWYITIPLLKNVFLYLLVTGFTLAMQEYLLPLIMTNGGPVGATTTPNLFIFNQFRDNSAFSFTYSLTAALILFIVIGAVSVLIFKAIKSDKAVDG